MDVLTDGLDEIFQRLTDLDTTQHHELKEVWDRVRPLLIASDLNEVVLEKVVTSSAVIKQRIDKGGATISESTMSLLILMLGAMTQYAIACSRFMGLHSEKPESEASGEESALTERLESSLIYAHIRIQDAKSGEDLPLFYTPYSRYNLPPREGDK